jgi:16S rRNA (guanine(1405)-N(7))-methyltransferase
MSKPSASLSVQQKETLIVKLQNSRKYRGLAIPHETLLNLVEEAEKHEFNLMGIEKNVRLKLHNLVALYLGDPDYTLLQARLAGRKFPLNDRFLQDLCLETMKAHASTAERLPFLPGFYQTIFEITGMPSSILDLACGLNPFAIPWMNLPSKTHYYAYDLNQPRIDAIDAFLHAINQPGAAIHSDILVDSPQVQADVAFFFKEAHRFEQRKKGCNREFFAALQVQYLLVSLPTSNLTGRRDMLEQDRSLIEQSTTGTNWEVTELLFENEIVFCIRKSA